METGRLFYGLSGAFWTNLVFNCPVWKGGAALVILTMRAVTACLVLLMCR